jgi:hypothetical protein
LVRSAGAQPFGSQQVVLPTLPPRPPPSPLFPTHRTPVPVRHTPLPLDPCPLPELPHPAAPEPSLLTTLDGVPPKPEASPASLQDVRWPTPERTAYDDSGPREESPVVRVRQFWQEVEAASGATPPSKVLSSRQLAHRYATKSDVSTGSAPKADARPRIVVKEQASDGGPFSSHASSGRGQGFRAPLSPITNPRQAPRPLAARFNTTTASPEMDSTNPFVRTSPTHAGSKERALDNITPGRKAGAFPHANSEGRADRQHSSQAGLDLAKGVPGGLGGVRNFWMGPSPGGAWHGGGSAATPPTTPMSDFPPAGSGGHEAITSPGHKPSPSSVAPPISHAQALESNRTTTPAGSGQPHGGREGGPNPKQPPGSGGVEGKEATMRRSGEKQKTSGSQKPSIARSLKFDHANQENVGTNSPKRGQYGVEGVSPQKAGAALGNQSDGRWVTHNILLTKPLKLTARPLLRQNMSAAVLTVFNRAVSLCGPLGC